MLIRCREYYHEKLAPASDVDLFLYGLNEEEAIEKIKQIEAKIRDNILHETTASYLSNLQYPLLTEVRLSEQRTPSP